MRALESENPDAADARAALAVVLALHEATDPRALVAALPHLIAGVIPYDRCDVTGELAAHRLTVVPRRPDDHRLAIRPTGSGRTLIGVVLGRRRAFTRRETTVAELLGPHLAEALDHARLRAAHRSSPATALTVLTVREREVLALVADGRRDRDIAEVLHIERRTVEKHVEHIRTKLGARSRAEAVARWARAAV